MKHSMRMLAGMLCAVFLAGSLSACGGTTPAESTLRPALKSLDRNWGRIEVLDGRFLSIQAVSNPFTINSCNSLLIMITALPRVDSSGL